MANPISEPDFITIDWDDIDEAECLRRILMLWNETPYDIQIWHRASANDGFHVWIQWPIVITPSERLSWRVFWMDDERRVMIYDRVRGINPAVVDYTHGVVFDMKDGKEAGEWQRWWP